MGSGVLTVSRLWDDPLELFADAGLERDGSGLLRLGGVSLEAVAADVGTPVYVYHAAPIRARYAELTEAFGALEPRLHYAVKANSSLAILRLLGGLGSGADIVSGGELQRALRAGIPPERIVFSGVGKTEAELDGACRAGVGSINLESGDELTALERVVARRNAPGAVGVGIRVNPDLRADTHQYITTGGEGIKFGVDPTQAKDMARRITANPRLRLTSLAMHLGSQILDPAVFAEGARRLRELAEELVTRGAAGLGTLDLGGGFGIRYDRETPPTPAQLAAALGPVLADRRFAVHLEPGRFLVGSAGVLLARVLYRKRSGSKTFVVVDAAMNDLLRPSHYEAHHAVVEVRARGREARPVDVVGPVCETGDFLALDRSLPEVVSGELIAILCVGAYGFVMASNYNSRPRPPEILVDRGRFALCRPRETVDDLLAGERLDPFAT